MTFAPLGQKSEGGNMANNNSNYVKIPKDIALIKQKMMFGLTKRQVICFGIGIGMGLPMFFFVKALISNLTIAIVAMGFISAPAIICGLYEKNGMHFEDTVKHMVQFFSKPKIRTYQSENAFTIIQRQFEYNINHKLLKTYGYIKEEGSVKNNWLKKLSFLKKK